MEHLLAGDIGGTKTALSLYVRSPDGMVEEVKSARYRSADYSGLLPIVRDFLREACGASELDSLRAAAFGVAGPVDRGVCRTTNLPWVIDAQDLGRRLGTRAALINDFQAVALGIGELRPNQLEVLQAGEIDPIGPIAVIGAGTGLGEAICMPTESGLKVMPTEGGHVDFAPRSELEVELLRFLWKRHPRVSVERVVSGMGIKALYDFVIAHGLASEAKAVREELEQNDAGGVIGGHALAGTDLACVRAVDLFVSLYGAAAGNLALKTLPSGGLYVTGGIAPKLLDKLRDGSFMHAFLDKGRMSSLLERVRVSVVLDARVGLLGALAHGRALAAD